MNEETDLNQMAEASMVEGLIEKATREEMAIAIKAVKSGKAARSKVCPEIISASGEVGSIVMMELCQRVLYGKGMPDEWQTSVLVSVFKEKGDVRNRNTYRGVNVLEHAMKIVERVLERIREVVNIDTMQFGLMPGRETTGALFVVRRIQEEYWDKKKWYMCFVDIENAFDKFLER